MDVSWSLKDEGDAIFQKDVFWLVVGIIMKKQRYTLWNNS